MRKTKLLFLFCSLFVAGAVMAEETTDKVVISELELAPGGEYGFFTVSLVGSTTTYTGYEVHFALPKGLDIYYSDGAPVVYMANDDLSLDGNDIYPYTTNLLTKKKTYTHTLSSNVIGDELTVACISTASENLTATSGALFHVFVQASPYLKPGNVEIGIKDVVLTENQGQSDGSVLAISHILADYVSTSVKASTTSTLTLKVSGDYKFGTCILPFDYTLPTDGSLEAYTSSSATDDALLLTKADKIEAYTPYILYSEAGFSQTISGAVNPDNYPAEGIVKQGCLVGAVVNKQLAEATSYVLQNQAAGTLFYQVDPQLPFSLPAGKCYAQLPEGTAASALRIGDTTGIAPTQNSTFNSQFSIFNLLGQPVKAMQPGHIYIVNGRKVVVK